MCDASSRHELELGGRLVGESLQAGRWLPACPPSRAARTVATGIAEGPLAEARSVAPRPGTVEELEPLEQLGGRHATDRSRRGVALAPRDTRRA